MERKPRLKIVDEIGQQIYERIMGRIPAFGGYTMEVAAVPESGKTSLLLSVYEDTVDRYPDELVFFRDSFNSQCQFNRVKKYNILAEKNVSLEFINAETRKTEDVPITYFEVDPSKNSMYRYKDDFGYEFKDLIDKAKPGCLNAIYLKDDARYRFLLRYLRLYPGFKTILFDEYEDLVPQRCKGKQWKLNEHYAYEFKHVRRGLLNVACDTQHPGDADWRVRSKFMIHGYLRGSKVPDASPVEQSAVNALPKGKVFLDYGNALYGKGDFDSYPPRDPVLIAVDRNRNDY